MSKHIFEAKNVDEAISKAYDELALSKDELIINITEEGTKGLFGIGNKKAQIEVIVKNDILEFGKEFIKTVTNQMGFEVHIESFKQDGYINYKLYSNQNGLLIGKDGKTLESLQFIIRQAIHNTFGVYTGVTLDVGGYKEKQQKRLERLAYKVSRTVAKTKIDAKLDPMNAYERRIIHNYLINDKYVYTESVGTDPERYVVIKPKA